MRKLLLLLFLCISVSVSATTYYLAPNGSDASGNGSSGSPWKTLAYACSKATASGDIIHINAGTYAETSASKLAVGVSIEGEGVNSIITSSVAASGSGAGAWTIQANSAMGTNGNQHISNIKMDGLNLTAWGGIGVNGRSNVKIYNCTFVNFLEVAVTFNGAAGYISSAPGTFGTGNELHDCIVTNCSGYRGSNDYGAGNIMIGGQNGLLIYNNTIVQTARTNNLNGYLIKYYSGGYNKGVKIYNNYLETAPRAGTQATSSWGFVLEQWNPIGGWEIYGNTIKGCLDLVNVSKGSYAFSFDIHDNTLGFNSTPPTGSTQGDVGIRLESFFQGVNIYKNHFKNHVCSVYASGENGPASDGLNMYYNIFENVGGDNNTGWVFRYTNDGSTYNVSNLNFWNNVMLAGTAHSTNYGITIPFGTVSNVSIRNNIISGFDQAPVQKGISGSGTNIKVENNIFYTNGNSNNTAGSISYSGYTEQNNLKVDPLFVSSANFHLQSSSPAIGKGIDVGLETDYEGNALKNPPSIGAFESGSAPVTPVAPVYQSSTVENATPSIIQMTYNLSLASIVPGVSAFNVQVNSVARTISSVAIVGGKVQLTLSSAVVSGDLVTVAYTAPASNPLQTGTGGLAENLSNKSVTNGCISAIPVYVSSGVENATPSRLELTYNLTLANIVPAASAFSVMVNSVARTVSSVVVSATKVQLTMESPVVFGDIVTVSYTKPSANPLQTAAGGAAITIGAQTVTNRVNSVNPVYVSSAVENATPSLLVMTYNMALANIVPAASAFSVMVNSAARTVSSVVVSATNVQLTLASPIISGDVVSVLYTKPAANPLQTTAGGEAITLAAQTVTNRVNSINPVYISSSVENATPSLLVMTYNMTLANIVPAASAFSVMVNSVARTVSSVVVSATNVQLTLASPIISGDVVSVLYTKPAANPLQTTSGGQAVTLGAQPVTNRVNSINPVYVSSAVENTTPLLLVMTYNLTLANIVPAASAFSVQVNSAARTVSSVIVSATSVQLTLVSPIFYGDVVTVSYTKPAANPLQTTAGGQAITTGAQTVTNKVIGISPVYVSSAIENATPSLLVMTYNMTLANVAPAVSSFAVMVNSVARPVNTVVISGAMVQLTLSGPVANGDVVTVAYTKPSSGPIQNVAGGQAITIAAQTVANRINGVNPNYVSSAIENATPSLLAMTYNMTLANITPAASSFSVMVNSTARPVNAVTVSGTKIQLTLTSRVFSGDIVKVSYSKPSGNPIQTTSGGIAGNITNQTVTNNCVNSAPTVKITSPVTNSSFTAPTNISITANASDNDGTVSLVEFYNGSTKLGSVSAAPYSFNWNNVPAGKYTLTAIATDNRNAKTTSSPISVSVTGSTYFNNRHPFIRIFNPRKGNIYSKLSAITIDAVASDSDGTIQKVEFFSDSVKLVELNSAPYSYTWKDVAPGKYTITAIATDNLNDTTVSSPIEFEVGANVKYDSNSDLINLYPNPNNGQFSIDFVNPLVSERGEIIITDLAGKQVYRGPVLKEETLKQFDLSNNRSGIYVMIIKDKEILVTKKFIKK